MDKFTENQLYLANLNELKNLMLSSQMDLLKSVRIINPKEEMSYNYFVDKTYQFSNDLESLKIPNKVVKPKLSVFQKLLGHKEIDPLEEKVNMVLGSEKMFNNLRSSFLLKFNPEMYNINGNFKTLYDLASSDGVLHLDDSLTFHEDYTSKFQERIF